MTINDTFEVSMFVGILLLTLTAMAFALRSLALRRPNDTQNQRFRPPAASTATTSEKEMKGVKKNATGSVRWSKFA